MSVFCMFDCASKNINDYQQEHLSNKDGRSCSLLTLSGFKRQWTSLCPNTVRREGTESILTLSQSSLVQLKVLCTETLDKQYLARHSVLCPQHCITPHLLNRQNKCQQSCSCSRREGPDKDISAVTTSSTIQCRAWQQRTEHVQDHHNTRQTFRSCVWRVIQKGDATCSCHGDLSLQG